MDVWRTSSLTNSSGDKDLDARIPDMIRSIPYPRPMDDMGEWVRPERLSFGAAEPHHTAPDCEAAVRAAPRPDPI